MNVNELTVGQAKEIAAMFSGKDLQKITDNSPSTFFKVGENYFIRTITMYYTGKLIAQNENELLLSNCAWIADTGRFTDAMETGDFDEVEIFPKDAEVLVFKSTILDAHVWTKGLPDAKK